MLAELPGNITSISEPIEVRTERITTAPTLLDAEVAAFRSRPLDGGPYPYLWLDATYVKVREGGRIVDKAIVTALGL